MKPGSDSLPRILKISLLLVFLVGCGFSSSGHAQEGSKAYDGPRFTGEKPTEALQVAKSLERAFHYAAEKVQPAVVTIYTQKEVRVPGFPFFFGPERNSPFRDFPQPFQKREVTGLGSGMVIREDGYILTNNHVVENVDDISVLLYSQQRVDAKLVGSDPLSDLAVIKVERTGLPTVEFANSDNVRVGQLAIAVGSPFSLRNTVSFGHVSAKHRAVRATQYEDFIQTDAPINRGNSGGPLVNINGEVIGVNTLIQSTSGGSQGIGFANASNLAQRTAKDLIKHGRVRRPWMGVSIQELSGQALKEHFNAEHGVIISDVVSGSPAEEAGLKQGDLVLSIDGEPVKTPHELQRKVISKDVDQQIKVKIKRDGETRTIEMTLGLRPDQEQARGPESGPSEDSMLSRTGLLVDELTPQEARQAGLNLERPVLRVKSVKPGSSASDAGLQPNDLILTVDRKDIHTPPGFEQYLQERAQQGASSVLLLVRRQDQSFYATLSLP